MQSLRQALTEAEKRNVAIGHFNTSDLTALRRRTRTEASRAGRGSEGAREFIGTRTAAAIVRSLRDESPFPIFLNVDHTYSLEKVKEVRRSRLRRSDFRCIEATARRELNQSKRAVRLSNQSVSGDPGRGRELLHRLLIRDFGEASGRITAHDDLEEARQFAAETGIDVVAPAVATCMVSCARWSPPRCIKHLDVPRIGAIKRAVGKFMTLHGGSGTADHDFVAAIKAGMTIVHVNTELRLAWRKGVEEGLPKDPDEGAPYKIMPPTTTFSKW